LKKVQAVGLVYASQRVNQKTTGVGIKKLTNALAAQLLDLRSVSAKEAGNAVVVLTECMADGFEQIGFKLLGKDNLVKLLHNGNKMLSEIGNSVIICLLHNVCSPRYVEMLQKEMGATKSPLVHIKMAQYLYLILTLYPLDVLNRVGS
jgi:hypothetical protein